MKVVDVEDVISDIAYVYVCYNFYEPEHLVGITLTSYFFYSINFAHYPNLYSLL